MIKKRMLGMLLICLGIALILIQWIAWDKWGIWIGTFPLIFIPFLALIGLCLVVGGIYMLWKGKQIENGREE